MNEVAIAALQRPSFFEAHIATAVLTVISAKETWTKVLGTTALDAARGFDMPAAGRFRLVDAEAGLFGVSFAFSMVSAAANDQFRFRLAKNGVTIERTEVRRFVSTPGDVGAAVCQGRVELRKGDFVELFAANWTDGDDLTVQVANVLGWSMGGL